jgi:hypothetical protein
MMCKFVNVTKWIKENAEEAKKQATACSQTNSKKMVNLLHIEDEESPHMGIEDMMMTSCVEEEKQTSDEENASTSQMGRHCERMPKLGRSAPPLHNRHRTLTLVS